jgi:prophage antirepressor-like protein
MQNKLQVFEFQSHKLTVIMDEHGEPWFIAKEVAEILGYSAAEAMTRRLDDDEKLVRQIVVSGQNRDVLLINESGLYSSIIGSTKPEAKAFKKWVTSEVLPAIRKTGSYGTVKLKPSEYLSLIKQIDTLTKVVISTKNIVRLETAIPQLERLHAMVGSKMPDLTNPQARSEDEKPRESSLLSIFCPSAEGGTK